MTAPLLAVNGLTKHYRIGERRVLALRGIDLSVARNEVVAVVGESGSGKSTLGHLVVGMESPTSGSIMLDGQELPPRRSRAQRRRLQLVQQNPLSALNPRRTVYQSVVLPLRIHRVEPRSRQRSRVAELLTTVGLAEDIMDRHPQVLSGGQRQRVALARAIAGGPDALVLDEPTSALDVSVQALVLELLVELQRRLALSYLFITHDLGVVAQVADSVAVMYAGRIVERGPVMEVLRAPRHPYTAGLLRAAPRLVRENLVPIPGTPPSPAALPPGCSFAPRCALHIPGCDTAMPQLRAVNTNHDARCILVP